MKKFVVGLLIGALLLCLSGIALADTVELRYWAEPGPAGYAEAIAEAFEVENPGVKVEVTTIPSGNFAQKVATAIAAGMPPNIVGDYIGRLGAWATAEATVPLTLTAEEAADFVPSMIDMFTHKGEVYGLPLRYWVVPYVVNKTMLDEVGVTIPNPSDFPLDLWLEAVEAVSQLEGRYGTAYFANGRSGDYMMLMNYQFYGAQLYESGDYTKTILNSAAGVEALELMLKVVEEGWAVPGVAGLNGTDFANLRHRGVVAMMPGSVNYGKPQYPIDLKADGLIDYDAEFILTGTPHANDSPNPGLYIGPSGVVALDAGDKVANDLAAKFIHFAGSAEQCLIMVKGFKGSFPTRRSISPFAPEEFWNTFTLDLIAANGVMDMGLASPFYLNVRDALYPEHQAAFTGMKTAKEALDDFAAKVAALWEE